MWEMHDGMGWWMIFAGFWMILFWGIIIGAVAWVIVRITGSEGRERGDAVEIAKQRYARGEIDREEFNRISEDLRRPG
jgi:putative membrane protein